MMEKCKKEKMKNEKKETKRKNGNITRCLWCFTLPMNLHDFVTEPCNPEHIPRRAHCSLLSDR